MNEQPALLALENGQIFKGKSVGREGTVQGAVVFNTAMTGYQETLTDPSYAERIVSFTVPHIGNCGVNYEDQESSKIWARGAIFRHLSTITSNWRAKDSLSRFLQQQNVVAISEIDTRYLTIMLREQGILYGCITTDPMVSHEQAIEQAKQSKGADRLDLTQLVTVKKDYAWLEALSQSFGTQSLPAHERPKIIVLDFGVKRGILRCLVHAGYEVVICPADSSLEAILAHRPSGIVLANGPGDPAACGPIIRVVQQLIETHIPILAICLGCQLIALAGGAQTYLMRLGHHGSNHPVIHLESKKVFITSQNHNFAVKDDTLPSNIQVTYRSLFDGTVQGIKYLDRPVLGFQGHPEGHPGPMDLIPLWNDFKDLVVNYQKTN